MRRRLVTCLVRNTPGRSVVAGSLGQSRGPSGADDVDRQEVECLPDLNEHLQSPTSKTQVK